MVQVSYPGVYVQEIPSGVRTITGVSTSVTAFIGSAKRGPIDRAVHVQDYSTFERIFGGLSEKSEMSFAVRQFFMNGGTDSWIVRIAKSARAAEATLDDAAGVPRNVIQVVAIDKGVTGNAIELRVDHATPNPASTFNLSVINRADGSIETHEDLSMDSGSSRYAETIVNEESRLVRITRIVDMAAAGLGSGTSRSGELVAADLVDDPRANELQVSVNGLAPITIGLTAADFFGGTVNARLVKVAAAIQTAVRAAANGEQALAQFTCARDGATLLMTSGVAGEHSSVRVLQGLRNDATRRLELGPSSGGTEIDAVAAIRPREVPDRPTLTSGTFAAAAELDDLPSAASRSLRIALDGQSDDPPVTLPSTAPLAPVTGTLAVRLGKMAAMIQDAVRALRPSQAAYKGFTCTVNVAGDALVLTSGSRGAAATIGVSVAPAEDIAAALKLTDTATWAPAKDVLLHDGDEKDFDDSEAHPLYVPDRSKREGLYALENVDLFNLLCLPGITDGGILSDANAYCMERRAFLIVDGPKGKLSPDEVLDRVQRSLPKSDHAAVFHPRILVPNPLEKGRLRERAPSGTIAGLYARTDATRGVWKAPAGIEATLVGVQGVTHVLTDAENGTLNPKGVNCLRLFPVYGATCWGARTLRGADAMTSEYKYVPVRRLALYIEESLYRGTQWVVFEPNDEPLWAQVRLNLGAFMHSLFVQGAFAGKSPREAYLVKCDKETTTQDDVNRGIVNILVAFAPLKPAEFVVIRIQQLAGQIQA